MTQANLSSPDGIPNGIIGAEIVESDEPGNKEVDEETKTTDFMPVLAIKESPPQIIQEYI